MNRSLYSRRIKAKNGMDTSKPSWTKECVSAIFVRIRNQKEMRSQCYQNISSSSLLYIIVGVYSFLLWFLVWFDHNERQYIYGAVVIVIQIPAAVAAINIWHHFIACQSFHRLLYSMNNQFSGFFCTASLPLSPQRGRSIGRMLFV